jgi:hypothetical protein
MGCLRLVGELLALGDALLQLGDDLCVSEHCSMHGVTNTACMTRPERNTSLSSLPFSYALSVPKPRFLDTPWGCAVRMRALRGRTYAKLDAGGEVLAGSDVGLDHRAGNNTLLALEAAEELAGERVVALPIAVHKIQTKWGQGLIFLRC